MLDLFLMDVDGHVGSLEVLQPTSMIKMQVAHDDGFHVFDVMAGLFDLGLQFMVFLVVHSGEDVVQRSAPDFGVIFSSARLEQDQPFGGVLDQD